MQSKFPSAVSREDFSRAKGAHKENARDLVLDLTIRNWSLSGETQCEQH